MHNLICELTAIYPNISIMWHAKKQINVLNLFTCYLPNKSFFFFNFKLNLKVFDRFLGCFPIFYERQKN